MSTDLLTVVTCTLGDSAGHLNRQAFDLRAFTKLPFRQIVSDDGTIDEGQKARQRDVCKVHSPVGTGTPMQWTENPGPVWGISYNLNHVLNLVETPWVFLVEDGLRPGHGWLETAIDFIERIGNRKWCGYPVGMAGTASFEDWQLALAGALPGDRSFLDHWFRRSAEAYSRFWGSANHPNWNDGLWCWKRLLPAFERVCALPESDLWPEGVKNFRHVIRMGGPPPELKDICRCPSRSWPKSRRVGCAWFPGAFMLINMGAWRKVERMAPGCTFFEGHLGIRMAQHGYLSFACEFPPWLHYAGMGFVSAGQGGRRPRHHEPADGPQSILLKDFGMDGEGHCDLYKLVDEHFPPDLQKKIDDEVASVELYMAPAWEAWQ